MKRKLLSFVKILRTLEKIGRLRKALFWSNSQFMRVRYKSTVKRILELDLYFNQYIKLVV